MGSGHWTDKDRFQAVAVINFILFIAEFYVGSESKSWSLTTDGFHAFLHVFAALVALASVYEFFGIQSEKIKTWSAGINLMLFFPLACMIAYEANERLKNPPIVELSLVFFLVAFLSLAANLYTILILKSDEKTADPENKNRFFLYIHMVLDTVGSVIVLAGAQQMVRTGNYAIDPIASFILAGLIVIGASLMFWEFVHGHSHGH